MRPIRVVVIDDSAFSRRTIIKLLQELPSVEVVGYATDGEEGIRRILDLKPDLATLDLEMPKMNGFTFLRLIMKNHPLPIIVVSAQSEGEKVFKALELGAVDFVVKPGGGVPQDLPHIRDDLHLKIQSLCSSNLSGVGKNVAGNESRFLHAPDLSVKQDFSIVAVGASTGGPPALQQILMKLPQQLPFPVLISQHMPAGFTKAFAERLDRMAGFEVKEAETGDLVLPGRVLIAPGGFNMFFVADGRNVRVSLKVPESSDRYVPSVDAMFSSLSCIYGPRLLGVVLTGMGNDGSKGARVIKAAGGEVYAESEESAVVFGMPKEAIASGSVDKIVSLNRMSSEIVIRCGYVPNHELN